MSDPNPPTEAQEEVTQLGEGEREPDRAPPDRAVALRVIDVSHRYESFLALNRVSLEVSESRVHCLLGPSGSGKSTLLRLIAGLEELQTGRVEIHGAVMAATGSPHHWVPPERRPVGFVFQDYALFPHLDVLHNVTFGMLTPSGSEVTDGKASAFGISTKITKAAKRESALRLLAQVDMADFANAMPHTLSGGQQQRVALARALARSPQVMLLDEPFSGLDTRLRAEVRASTLAVLKEAGVATIVVTHDPQEALLVGDEVSVLQAGELLQTGSSDEVYRRSATTEVAEIFGPLNRFAGIVEGGTVAVPWGRASAPEFEEGSRVEIAVRADSVLVEPLISSLSAASSAQGSSGSRLRGAIQDVQPMQGAVLLLVALEDGTQIKGMGLVGAGWQGGEAVNVEVLEGAEVVRPIA